MKDEQKHLYNMHELSDYKVSDGYPDVRGWDVKDNENRVIGKVDHLLVNKAAERVVYLDVEVDRTIIDAKHDPYRQSNNEGVREFLNKEGENHIIIPIGLVDLNEDSNYVYTDVIDHKTFAETKRYHQGDTIKRGYEKQVLDSYSRKKDRRKDRVEPQHESDSDNELSSLQNEGRLREIIRDEIRKYHNNLPENEKTRSQKRFSDDDAEEVVLNDDDFELERQRQQREEDEFYKRGEFDDERFRR